MLIQSLRAFRRAEVIVNAVWCESRVGGVAVAMIFASIFHFEFGFLWGVFSMLFGCLLEAFWIPRASLGVLLGSFGGTLQSCLQTKESKEAVQGDPRVFI